MQTIVLSVGVVVGLLVVTCLVLYCFGRSLPERHTATLRFAVPQARATVWAALTDYAAMEQWWPAVKSVRLEPQPDGTIITWNTDRRGEVLGFRTCEEKAPARLGREITGHNLPFGGRWTYELAEEDGGTAITITEDGFITPPFFRGLMKLIMIMKPEATMRDFAQHLTAYLARR